MKKIPKITVVAMLLTTQVAFAQHEFNWAYSIGGSGQEYVARNYTDANGYMYAYGSFSSDSIDVAPGSSTTVTFNNAGGMDGFITKLDTAGMHLWSIQIGGNYHQQVNDLIVDPSGIYICGYFQDTVDFDPSPAVSNLIGSFTQFSSFIAKYNHSGGLIWVKAISSWSQANAMCFNYWGNLAVVGHFGYTIDADPGPGVVNHTTNGGHECFLVELTTATGNYVQSTSWGGSLIDRAYDVANMNGQTIVVGAFSDTCDFAPDTATYNVIASGVQCGFALSLDQNLHMNWVQLDSGSYSEYKRIEEHASSVSVAVTSDHELKYILNGGGVQWSHDFGGTIYINSIYMTQFGDVIIGGISGSSVDMDPGPAYSYIGGGIKGFWAEFSCSWGTFHYVKTIDELYSVSSMTMSPDGRFNISGVYMDTVDMNPAAGQSILVSTTPSINDIYIAQFRYCNPTAYTYDVNLCADDTIILNGLHFVATEFAPNYPQIVCLEFNQAYTPDETFTWIDDIDGGCDTIRTVTLHGKATYASTQTFTICGGDSVVVGTVAHTTSGTFTDILSSVFGCDSVITTNLTVNTVDTSLTISWSTLYSNAAGATYQWIDCSTGNPIAGANAFSYTATANGEYACVVTENSCTDTSGCYTLTEVGVSELNNEGAIRCYPNPTSGMITLSASSVITSVRIFDLSGRLVASVPLQGSVCVLDISILPAGTYMLEVIAGNTPVMQRVTKE